MLRSLSVLASVALALISALAKNAEAFPIHATATFTPSFAQATACNTSFDVPIECRTTAYGQAQTGVWVHYWANLVLYPGQCEYAYVYARYPLYFIDSRASAECWFLRPSPMPMPAPILE